MKIRFGQTDWNALRYIAGSIRIGSHKDSKVNHYRIEMQKKVMAGIARAIEAEFSRVTAAGEPAGGQVVFSLDLHIERFDIPAPRPIVPNYSLLAELDDLLNKKEPQDLIEW